MQFVNKIKYFGATMQTVNKFCADLSETRRKYLIAVNSLLNKCKRASHVTKLHLDDSHCLQFDCIKLGVFQLNKATNERSKRLI